MNPAVSTRCLCASLLLILGGLALPASVEAAGAAGAGDPMSIDQAKSVYDSAIGRVKDRRSTNEDLRAAVNDLATVHARVGPAGRGQVSLRRRAEGGLLRALVLVRTQRRAPEVNLRAPINVRAAEKLAEAAKVLGTRERRSLSKQIRRLVDKQILARWESEHWSQDHLDATFAALAALGDPATVKWIVEEYTHTKEREAPFLIAAHKALRSFDVDAKLRFQVVGRMVLRYSSVELVAERSSNTARDAAKKRFWDRVRSHVIPAVQHHAGRPTNEKDEALSTMREFQVWWRSHDKLGQPPWTD